MSCFRCCFVLVFLFCLFGIFLWEPPSLPSVKGPWIWTWIMSWRGVSLYNCVHIWLEWGVFPCSCFYSFAPVFCVLRIIFNFPIFRLCLYSQQVNLLKLTEYPLWPDHQNCGENEKVLNVGWKTSGFLKNKTKNKPPKKTNKPNQTNKNKHMINSLSFCKGKASTEAEKNSTCLLKSTVKTVVLSHSESK